MRRKPTVEVPPANRIVGKSMGNRSGWIELHGNEQLCLHLHRRGTWLGNSKAIVWSFSIVKDEAEREELNRMLSAYVETGKEPELA